MNANDKKKLAVSGIDRAKLAIRKTLTPFARRVLGQVESHEVDVAEVGTLTVVYRRCEADQEILRQMAVDHFLAAIPDYTPTTGHVVIDLGAHIGSFAMNVGLTGAVVHAIEARRETHNLLRINAKLNRLPNVVPYHLALADHDGECELYYSWMGNWGDSVVDVTTIGSETVPCQTLESFMGKHLISHCDLLKSNCEGSEFGVLLSTPPDVLARIDRMIVLYHCDLDRQRREDSLVRHLQAAGFTTRLENQDADRGWIIASRRC